MPSPVLVREALDATGLPAGSVRLALAVAAALGETPLTQAGGDLRAVQAELAERAGLTVREVAEGIEGLRVAGLLVEDRGAAVALDPDLLCTLPVLGRLSGEACRTALAGGVVRLAPALAVVRALARLSRPGPDGGGGWLVSSVQDLAEETLYGRTAVTQALAHLAEAGLIERAGQPARRGLRLRVTARALGAETEAASGKTPQPTADTAPARAAGRAGQGVTVEVGGARVAVPAGSTLSLPAGQDYRLEIGPDGAAIIRID